MTLEEIFEKVKAENQRSRAKYGMWRDIPEDGQHDAIQGEFGEWENAYYAADTHGEHGELRELVQVINCCVRRIQFLTGEEDA